MIKAKNGKRIIFFQTKEGTDLSGRNQVIDFMQKNNYHKEEIELGTNNLYIYNLHLKYIPLERGEIEKIYIYILQQILLL